MTRSGLRIARLVLVLLILAAIGTQLRAGALQPGFNAVNFFSFFTIISNLFGALSLLLAALGLPAAPRTRDILRGAATCYLVIVGVVFSLLLTDVESDIIPWVNTVLHYVMPLAITADWCLDPPATRMRARDAALWMPLLAAYIAWTLLRGAVVHWYPYPFLNADRIGYAAVALYSVGIAVFAFVTAFFVMFIGNRLHERRGRSAP
jgi:hypothetical protein